MPYLSAEPGSADPKPPVVSATRTGQAADLDEDSRRRPIHEGDKAPSFLLRAQAWFYGWISTESRVLISIVIILIAVFAAVVLSSIRFLQIVFDGIDVVALIGLFLVNWIGNGGALVPIPGVRFIGLLMIFQQSVVLPSWEVFGVAGAAMALGLASYYIAGARTAQSYAEGDTAGAEQLAEDTGMLGGDTVDFSPGAALDAEAVAAMTGTAGSTDAPADAATEDSSPQTTSTLERFKKRFSSSLKKAQDRARPVIEQRGTGGMFLLCFAPSPMGTAAAFLGGLMRFGFARYLAASFAAKYLLAGVIVALALISNDAARTVSIP